MNRALVIGASSGIGAATAVALAAKGWEVLLHGRDAERLAAVRAQLDGAGHTLVSGDVVEWAEDPKRIPPIEPVDLVVWSAGICELSAAQMLSLKAVRRTLAVNLEAPLVVLSHFYRKGVVRDGGTIVLLGSEAAHDAGEGFAVYAASKGGLAAAARVLAKEFARRRVRVVCLEPGTVDTPMTRRLVAAFGGLKGGHMERMISPEHVAAQIVALLG